MKPIVVWFRRDLRTDDHAALVHAASTGSPVIPLFIIDEPLIAGLPSDGAAFDFQAEALRDLKEALTKAGGALIVRRGDVESVHRAIIREAGPSALYYNRDYEPSAIRRDQRIEAIYRSAGLDVRSFADTVIHEPADVLTADGRPYVVFTPFSRTWKSLPHPEPSDAPRSIRTPRLRSGPIPGARELGRPVGVPEPAVRGGLRAAKARWKKFLATSVADYATGRNTPAARGTSRMSPYLRFGCISPRRMLADLVELSEAARTPPAGVQKFVDELIWREFYQAVLYHFPRLVTSNFREEFDAMPWSRARRPLEHWREGKTGFPFVDAGMRELSRTGWMHNRVRMVVASFLTKDLMIDWRRGEAVFAEKLLDIDTASNNGGWQWSASTGVDPKPMRIFNPTLQGERYDPEGIYIREHVPELRRVPDAYIHAPHTMPPLVQQEAGCIIGKDYPAPIVDHKEAANRYKQAYYLVKERGKKG